MQPILPQNANAITLDRQGVKHAIRRRHLLARCVGTVLRLVAFCNQMIVMCTTRGEIRLISIRCQKEGVESNLVISCRMMHNLIKIYHVVQELCRIFFN